MTDRVTHITLPNGENYTNYVCDIRGASRLHGHLSIGLARLQMQMHRAQLEQDKRRITQ